MAPKRKPPHAEMIPPPKTRLSPFPEEWQNLPGMASQRTADQRTKARRKAEKEAARANRGEEEKSEGERVAHEDIIHEKKWQETMQKHEKNKRELHQRVIEGLDPSWQHPPPNRPPANFGPPNLIPTNGRTWEEYDEDPDQVAIREAAETLVSMRLTGSGENELRGKSRSTRSSASGCPDLWSNATSSAPFSHTASGERSTASNVQSGGTASEETSTLSSGQSSRTVSGETITAAKRQSNTASDAQPSTTSNNQFDSPSTIKSGTSTSTSPPTLRASSTSPSLSHPKTSGRPPSETAAIQSLASGRFPKSAYIQLSTDRLATPTTLSDRLASPTHLEGHQRAPISIPVSTTTPSLNLIPPTPARNTNRPHHTPLPTFHQELSILNSIIHNAFPAPELQHLFACNPLLSKTFKFYAEWISHLLSPTPLLEGKSNHYASTEMAIADQSLIRWIYYTLSLATFGRTFWDFGGILGVCRHQQRDRQERKCGRRSSIDSNATIASPEPEKREERYITWALEKSWIEYLSVNGLLELQTREWTLGQVSFWRKLVGEYSDFGSEMKEEEDVEMSEDSESEDDLELIVRPSNYQCNSPVPLAIPAAVGRSSTSEPRAFSSVREGKRRVP